MKVDRVILGASIAALVGCGARSNLELFPPPPIQRPSACGGSLEARECDAGAHAVDAGAAHDAGARDAGIPDAGPHDAGLRDADVDSAIPIPTSCGNGDLDPGEECDDGANNGAACSARCKEQKVLQLAVGGGRTCAVLSGGVVKCWGYVSGGFLGLGDTKTRGDQPNEMGSNLPAVDLGTGGNAFAVSLGNDHTCVLLRSGNVKCWGLGSAGQLGAGNTDSPGEAPGEMGDALPIVDLGSGKSARAVSAGADSTCAVLNDYSVKCWGSNDAGQLGLGDTRSRGSAPNEMGDALPVVSLGTGAIAREVSTGCAHDSTNVHACALLNDGSIKCWGANYAGQLGLGDTVSRGNQSGQMGDHLPAVMLGTGKTALAVSAGYGYTCALLNDHSVKCWGSAGEIGAGDMISRGGQPNQMGDNLPIVDLGVGKTAQSVIAGYGNACALLNDDSVKCWGLDYDGQLGLGDAISRGDQPNQMGEHLPAVDLGMGRTARAVSVGSGASAGGVHTCALLDDSSVKCWGAGGELGLGNLTSHGAHPNEMGDHLPPVILFSAMW